MSILFRRRALPALACAMASALGLASLPVRAQPSANGYPTKTVRLVVSFAPGGVGDMLARQLQQRLQDKYGQPVIVESKPGASGTLAADLVAKAAPDGHTLLVTNQLVVQAPNLFTRLPYDPMRDLVPVTELGGAPIILAVNAAQTSARTLPEFVEEVRRKPKTFSYASVGLASMGHLYGVQLADAAGIDLLHVPYKGSAPVVQALVGGEVQAAFSDYPTMRPYIESGRLRLLAVSRPYAATPGLPTFAALGYKGLESYSWIGMFMPARTPPAIVQQMAADVAAVSRLPEVARRVNELGLDSGGMPQAQFAAMVAADHARWADIMKKAGIKPE